MSNSAFDQVLHPEPPALDKVTNTPRNSGQTRVLPDGSLLYLDPLTDTEVPAVRLHDIRPRLVEEASTKLSYRFPKKRGFEDTNVTAFVKKDYNFGPARDNRPDRLFQIESTSEKKGDKPEGYVVHEGRIVLDAFDHGLRNFGNQLPMYVSSELEGHDIEDYLRRNGEIALYDLVARAPNGYWTGNPEKQGKQQGGNKIAQDLWHEGPPRVGTFSMRATRFRQSAGCLSWSTKDGTAPKNQRILDLIPAEFKDPAVNSTKSWRDLKLGEIKSVQAGHKKTPQKARKKNRAAKAEQHQQNNETATTGLIEEEGDLGGNTFVDGGDSGVYGVDQRHDELPLGTFQVHHMNSVQNGQQKDYTAVSDIQFAEIDNVQSMHARYNVPPLHEKRAKSKDSKVTKKRKRRTSTSTSTSKHMERQRPSKRALTQPLTPSYHTTPQSAPRGLGADNSIPTTGLVMPMQHEQMDTQSTEFPPTATDDTEFLLQQMYQYIDADKYTEEDSPMQQPAQMLPFKGYTYADSTGQHPSQMLPFNGYTYEDDTMQYPAQMLPVSEQYEYQEEMPHVYEEYEKYEYPEHINMLSPAYWP